MVTRLLDPFVWRGPYYLIPLNKVRLDFLAYFVVVVFGPSDVPFVKYELDFYWRFEW